MNVSVIDGNGQVVRQNPHLASPYHFTFTVSRGDYSVRAVGDTTEIAHVWGDKTTDITLGAACL